jgi:hypothetical protein
MITWDDKLPSLIDRTNPSNEDIIRGIKNWRTRELASCDWTQLADSPVANKQAWATYRQKLRDLPQQGPDPKLWVFPVPPT